MELVGNEWPQSDVTLWIVEGKEMGVGGDLRAKNSESESEGNAITTIPRGTSSIRQV